MSASVKRKATVEAVSDDGSDSDSSAAPSFINVDFDFVAPTEIDYHALKRLLQQLFYTHATQLDLAAIVDNVIQQASTWGTVVKVDQNDDDGNDPFAFVSAVDMATTSTAVTSLQKYLQDRLSISSDAQAKALHALLANAATSPLLLVLHERMVNLPPQIAPPLYRILLDEIKADREGKPALSHLLFFSRVFSAAAFSDDEEMASDDEDAPRGMKGAGKAKRRKAAPKAKPLKAAPLGPDEMGLFHPEDSILAKFAAHTYTFRFPPPKDAAENYEAPLFGRIVALPYAKATEMLREMESALGNGSGGMEGVEAA